QRYTRPSGKRNNRTIDQDQLGRGAFGHAAHKAGQVRPAGARDCKAGTRADDSGKL
ncbi:hypothetical protein LPJ56_006207, partial [Coemansia sp. RSA 2599]